MNLLSGKGGFFLRPWLCLIGMVMIVAGARCFLNDTTPLDHRYASLAEARVGQQSAKGEDMAFIVMGAALTGVSGFTWWKDLANTNYREEFS